MLSLFINIPNTLDNLHMYDTANRIRAYQEIEETSVDRLLVNRTQGV